MSESLFLRGFFVAIISGALAYSVFTRYDWEIGEENKKQKYIPYFPSTLLPMVLLVITVLAFADLGAAKAVEMTFPMWFSIFLHIAIYYSVLMMLVPLLRKWICARACAVLWMIPNYLYFTQYSIMEVSRPLLVLRLSENWIWILFALWLAGFAGIMIWKIASHLRFRRWILKGAQPVNDPRVLAVWETEVQQARFSKPKFQLVVSPNVTTPVSVGMFRRSTRVVLPERPYSDQELSLILRHELIHIGREDGASKFFLVFCMAMCWFNPLMWVAMKKSAEDLERSCDETVLLEAEESVRRQYADLILKTAGDARGFTTCLSASAQSLRYRLKNIMTPKTKPSGALVVGLIFFALCMTCGYTAVSYEPTTGADAIFCGQDIGEYALTQVDRPSETFGKTENSPVVGTPAFFEYLAQLKMEKVVGNYSFDDRSRYLSFWLESPDGHTLVSFQEDMAKVMYFWGDRENRLYYLPEGMNFDYIETLLMDLPSVQVRIERVNTADSIHLEVTPGRVERNSRVIYEMDFPEDVYTVFGVTDPRQAELTFSQQPDRFRVERWFREGEEPWELVSKEAERSAVFPLAGDAAYYRVRAQFRDPNGSILQTDYLFSIEDKWPQ